MAEKYYSDILLWLVAGLALGAVAYLVFMHMQPVTGGAANQPPGNSTQAVNSTANTAVIDITIINPPDCPACRPLTEVLPQLLNITAQFNLSVGYVANLSGSEGAAMISKYNIVKLPALVVTGNFSNGFASWWVSGPGTHENDGALVLRNIYPPYYENGSTVGLVDAIAIGAPGCPKCMNPGEYITSLTDPRIDMKFSNTTVLQGNDTAAEALIAKYNITKLPALLLSDDAGAYPIFGQYILPLGENIGGWFVLRNATPPYLDLQSGNVRGLVEAVYIVNSSCSDCFNVSGMSSSLAMSSGVRIVNSTTYEADSAQGKALIAKYNISAIPTILYSPEASAYNGFTKLWLKSNSTIESDGWYVFRSYSLLAVPYQNITG